MAQNRRSDPGRIKHETTDVQRDIAAKGGPATGLGDAQNRKASAPEDHNIASTRRNRNEDKPSVESQTKNRSGNRVPGSNH